MERAEIEEIGFALAGLDYYDKNTLKRIEITYYDGWNPFFDDEALDERLDAGLEKLYTHYPRFGFRSRREAYAAAAHALGLEMAPDIKEIIERIYGKTNLP